MTSKEKCHVYSRLGCTNSEMSWFHFFSDWNFMIVTHACAFHSFFWWYLFVLSNNHFPTKIQFFQSCSSTTYILRYLAISSCCSSSTYIIRHVATCSCCSSSTYILQHVATSSCRSGSAYILRRGVGGKPKILAKRDPSFSNSTWESIFRMNVHFYLLPENWVPWISPNIWRDTVSKWTHRLLKEGNNLERSLFCARWGCYPRLSGGGSELIKVVPLVDRLPRRFHIIEHR